MDELESLIKLLYHYYKPFKYIKRSGILKYNFMLIFNEEEGVWESYPWKTKGMNYASIYLCIKNDDIDNFTSEADKYFNITTIDDQRLLFLVKQ